jgi:hypothetical protein
MGEIKKKLKLRLGKEGWEVRNKSCWMNQIWQHGKFSSKINFNGEIYQIDEITFVGKIDLDQNAIVHKWQIFVTILFKWIFLIKYSMKVDCLLHWWN